MKQHQSNTCLGRRKASSPPVCKGPEPPTTNLSMSQRPGMEDLRAGAHLASLAVPAASPARAPTSWLLSPHLLRLSNSRKLSHAPKFTNHSLMVPSPEQLTLFSLVCFVGRLGVPTPGSAMALHSGITPRWVTCKANTLPSAMISFQLQNYTFILFVFGSHLTITMLRS